MFVIYTIAVLKLPKLFFSKHNANMWMMKLIAMLKPQRTVCKFTILSHLIPIYIYYHLLGRWEGIEFFIHNGWVSIVQWKNLQCSAVQCSFIRILPISKQQTSIRENPRFLVLGRYAKKSAVRLSILVFFFHLRSTALTNLRSKRWFKAMLINALAVIFSAMDEKNQRGEQMSSLHCVKFWFSEVMVR